MKEFLRQRINLWVLVGAGAFALVLTGYAVALLLMLPGADEGEPQASSLTLVPAPSATVYVPTSTTAPTATAAAFEGIAIGMYVQIAGTDGDGLQIREAPGVGSQPRFLGMDAEVFLVIDGPRDQDGYTWWMLKAPYDEMRNGWAASRFLQAIAQP